MELFGVFLAGFASGWVSRSTVTSARSVAVKAITAFYVVQDRARRWVATEREFVEDMFAEARAQYDADRLRTAPRPRPSTRPTEVRRHERAA